MFIAGLRKQSRNYGVSLVAAASRRAVSSKPPPSSVPPVEEAKTPSSSSTAAGSAGSPDKEVPVNTAASTLAAEAETPKTPRQKRQYKKKQAAATGNSTAASNNVTHPQSKYLAFEDFPRIPKELSNASDAYLNQVRLARSFYPLALALVPESTEVKVKAGKAMNGDADSRPYHDFYIPTHHMKAYQFNNEADRLLNELNEYPTFLPMEFSDLNHPPHVEHPLKRSWSKIMPLNPGLHAISNEYLWELVPESKFFKSPPFDAHTDSLNGFQDWEIKMKEKAKQRFAESLKDQQEANKAIKEFNENKSFITPSQSGGRKKLNRKLVKTFRKLQNEGKLGNKDEHDD